MIEIEEEEEEGEQGRIQNFPKKYKLLTDITPLLSLPQKIAALKLGITESMLSKKYKQATNKKWPFRFLSKMDREIDYATTEEEKEYLRKKKQELLSPVSIYLKRMPTPNDLPIIENNQKK